MLFAAGENSSPFRNGLPMANDISFLRETSRHHRSRSRSSRGSTVLLEADAATPCEKNRALARAADRGKLELVELLAAHGADPKAIHPDTVFSSHDPQVIRWFAAQGMDLETGYPIARAFQNKQREFLGVYMDIRDSEPSARKQAAMALRYHVTEGNMKWVSLLLWAGADPRMPVPQLDRREAEEYVDTALTDAVQTGRLDMLKKFKVDPATDNLSQLLAECWLTPQPKVAEFLITLGANVEAVGEHYTPMQAAFMAFEWSLDPMFGSSCYTSSRTEDSLKTIEMLATRGAHWYPEDRQRWNYIRRSLASIPAGQAIGYLRRIIKSGAIEPNTFKELMKTPKMKALLKESAPGVADVRKHAGYDEETQWSRHKSRRGNRHARRSVERV